MYYENILLIIEQVAQHYFNFGNNICLNKHSSYNNMNVSNINKVLEYY